MAGYVDNVKSLATIRQAAYDVITEDPFGSSWDEVSTPLLQDENRFRRWEDLFLPSFTARVCGIVDARFALLSTDLMKRVQSFFAGVGTDRYFFLSCEKHLVLVRSFPYIKFYHRRFFFPVIMLKIRSKCLTLFLLF